MGRILTTGGAGFAGLRPPARPAELNDVVTVIDCLSPTILGEAPERSATYKSNTDQVWFVGSSATP
jgi:hypothetical protein